MQHRIGDEGADGTRPSGGVNLTAFDRRFSNICRQARLSATSSTEKSDSPRTISTFPFSAFSRNMSQQSLTKGSNSNCSARISNFPASIFDMSRTRLTTESRCSADEWMMRAYSIRFAGSVGASLASPRISEKPKIALSGVRNSWLTFASSLSFSEMASAVSARADSSRCWTSLRRKRRA